MANFCQFSRVADVREKKSYRITTSERKLVLICYLNIYYIVKYMQKRIAITETNGKRSICFKYYLFICKIITITDKILQYDTRFLGKELPFHS